MSERQVLGVWANPRGTDVAPMVVVAQDRLEPPDFEMELVPRADESPQAWDGRRMETGALDDQMAGALGLAVQGRIGRFEIRPASWGRSTFRLEAPLAAGLLRVASRQNSHHVLHERRWRERHSQ